MTLIRPRLREYWAVLLTFLVFYEGVVAFLGQDMNADLLNYHISASYQFLHGGDLSRFAVSQRQSWFNPLANLPSYGLIMGLPGWLASIVLAALPAANALMIYVICRRFLFTGKEWEAMLLSFACALVGGTGSFHFLVVGTTFTEAWLSAIILFGIYLGLAAFTDDGRQPGRMLMLSGACLGAGFGLKSTNVVYAFAGIVAVTAALIASRRDFRLLTWFAVGGIVAFAVSGGWWMAKNWHDFGNPTFPMMNNVFRSRWAEPVALLDAEFLPKHWWQLFADPLAMAVGDHHRMLSTFMPNRDARSLIGLGSAFVGLGSLIATGLRRGVIAIPIIPLFMVAFYLSAYIGWFFLFNVERYLIPLELLSAAMLGMVVDLFTPVRARRTFVILLVTMALVLVTTRPIRSWRVPISADWFALQVPPQASEPNTLFVMTGTGYLAWLIAFPKALGGNPDFVRVGGNLPIPHSTELARVIAARIANHRGPIRSLTSTGYEATSAADLSAFGLSPAPGECVKIISKAAPIVTCPLVRSAAMQ